MSDTVYRLRALTTEDVNREVLPLAEQAAAEIEQLRSIVERLPQTADGVILKPGDCAYLPNGDMFFVGMVSNVSVREACSGVIVHGFNLFTTRDAAEAARGKV